MISLIAEWGQPRSAQEAIEQIKATCQIGATYAKWQMFRPDRLASPEAERYWDPALGGDESQLGTFRPSLVEREWRKVFWEARSAGVIPLATPFDLEAVELLERLDASAYKIASGDITYRPLLDAIRATRKRVFLSTGAASEAEIDRAVSWLGGCPLTILACDLVYPCPASQASLAESIPRLRERFNYDIGYSDHTREIVTGAVAATLGATVLEKHVTLDPEGDAPDDRMALSVRGAKLYRLLADDAASLCSRVTEDPQNKARIGARRSAHAARPLGRGQLLRDGDIAWLRPCPAGAIGPENGLVGEHLARAVAAGAPIRREDVA